MSDIKQVLIVDDQLFIRKVFTQHIVENIPNVRIMEAPNGNVAVGIAKVATPDLILMDIIMGGADGIEALKMLKSDEHTKNIPVIMVSSHAEQEKQSQAMAAGADMFIDKARLNDLDLIGIIKEKLGVVA